jgi:hypothetical protein
MTSLAKVQSIGILGGRRRRCEPGRFHAGRTVALRDIESNGAK